jgi:hypothetical protein
MVTTIQAAKVPLILCNPVANLRDASPFKSQHTEGLPIQQIERTERVLDLLELQPQTADLNETKTQLEFLARADPRHAEVQFLLGQTIQQQGDYELAKRYLISAKEEDVCPLRMIEPMYESLARVAIERKVTLVDVKTFFEKRAPDGIPGSESFLDHVHPMIHGHQLISELLMDEMVRLNLTVRVGEPEQETALFETHLASLPYLYFELGKDRLAGLKRWAEGRVTKERPEFGEANRQDRQD